MVGSSLSIFKRPMTQFLSLPLESFLPQIAPPTQDIFLTLEREGEGRGGDIPTLFKPPAVV
jgi:hypothetical protein